MRGGTRRHNGHQSCLQRRMWTMAPPTAPESRYQPLLARPRSDLQQNSLGFYHHLDGLLCEELEVIISMRQPSSLTQHRRVTCDRHLYTAENGAPCTDALPVPQGSSYFSSGHNGMRWHGGIGCWKVLPFHVSLIVLLLCARQMALMRVMGGSHLGAALKSLVSCSDTFLQSHRNPVYTWILCLPLQVKWQNDSSSQTPAQCWKRR
jgi:hypothetical protein